MPIDEPSYVALQALACGIDRIDAEFGETLLGSSMITSFFEGFVLMQICGVAC